MGNGYNTSASTPHPSDTVTTAPVKASKVPADTAAAPRRSAADGEQRHHGLNDRFGLTTFAIKMIGVVLMVVDHIHQMFTPFGAPGWLDWFGRPVATLFFFVSVIGFSHTHSKRTYIWRLYVCMVLMALLMQGLQTWVGFDKVQLINNIFRDLFIGTVFMSAVDQFEASAHGHRARHIALGVLLLIIPFVLSVAVLLLSNLVVSGSVPRWTLTLVLAFDPAILLAENTLMVLLIPVLYIFRNKRWIQCLAIAVCAAIYAVMHQNQWIMIFAIIPILLYNGNKGHGDKYFFYIFYPAHIAVLYLIAAAL